MCVIGNVKTVCTILLVRQLYMTLCLLKVEKSGKSTVFVGALIRILVYSEEKMVQVVIK